MEDGVLMGYRGGSLPKCRQPNHRLFGKSFENADCRTFAKRGMGHELRE